ncbi:MAG: type II toxin-antitoxin system PemK/MazF family toxin [Defluviitaleaceae bacterium]|nr:type II toxin-antitoxin system PemK/MazF family toxin [Defluviitaleaceae bacterium]MCL2200166.1 type II toxin-antitoxin system PemK/MazF family toxin [Defluviitaleaceae bacterium]
MKQGDIISLDFDPTKGREQAGYRPAVVISQSAYNKKRDLVLVCPITGSTKPLRFRIMLDDRTETQGDIICEQVRVIDLLARKCKVIEQLPKDLLKQVLEAVSVIIAFEE